MKKYLVAFLLGLGSLHFPAWGATEDVFPALPVVWSAHGLSLPLVAGQIRQNTPERLLVQQQTMVVAGHYWRASGTALRDMARSAFDALNLEEGSAEMSLSEASEILGLPAYLIAGRGRQGDLLLDFALLVFQNEQGDNFSFSILHDDPAYPGENANEQAVLMGLQRVSVSAPMTTME